MAALLVFCGGGSPGEIVGDLKVSGNLAPDTVIASIGWDRRCMVQVPEGTEPVQALIYGSYLSGDDESKILIAGEPGDFTDLKRLIPLASVALHQTPDPTTAYAALENGRGLGSCAFASATALRRTCVAWATRGCLGPAGSNPTYFLDPSKPISLFQARDGVSTYLPNRTKAWKAILEAGVWDPVTSVLLHLCSPGRSVQLCGTAGGYYGLRALACGADLLFWEPRPELAACCSANGLEGLVDDLPPACDILIIKDGVNPEVRSRAQITLVWNMKPGAPAPAWMENPVAAGPRAWVDLPRTWTKPLSHVLGRSNGGLAWLPQTGLRVLMRPDPETQRCLSLAGVVPILYRFSDGENLVALATRHRCVGVVSESDLPGLRRIPPKTAPVSIWAYLQALFQTHLRP